MTKQELRHIAREALNSEYGFSPKSSDIRLLEADDTGLYILFAVKDHEYRFDSRYFPIGRGENQINTIWCGKGTIEKIS
jgi:hypothetical protein